MAQQNQNLEISAGDSQDLIVTVKDGNGNVINITGAVISYSLFKNVNSPTLVSKSTSNGGITITSALGGQFKISLISSDTQKLAGTYEHSVKLTDVNNYTTTILVGTVTIDGAK